MKRENRYLILKHNDIAEALSAEDIHRLYVLSQKVEAHRSRKGKAGFEAVVIEHDWPEYETVWNMLAARVDAEESGEQNA